MTFENLDHDILPQTRSTYKDLVEKISDWIWEVDQEGRYTFASPQVKTILGYHPGEVIGKRPFDFMPRDEAERVYEIFLHYVNSGKPFEFIENINLHKNGSRVVLETSGIPIFDAQDNLLGYRGIDRNITRRKKAEEELKQSELKYAALVNNIPGMVYIGHPDWTAEILSGCQMVTGFSHSEVNAKARGWLDLIHPDDIQSVARRGADILKQPQAITQVYRIFDKHRDIRWVEDRKQSMFSQQGELIGISGVVFDITDRKLSEKKLKQYSDNLEQMVEIRTRELDEKSLKLSEMNTALKVIVKSREHDKDVLQEEVVANLKNLVFPFVDILKKNAQQESEKTIIDVLESNLKEVVLTFSDSLSSRGYGLTATEMVVADLIRKGKSTQEIADIRSASHKTIEVHRVNIRKKLGIVGKKINLETFLRSLR